MNEKMANTPVGLQNPAAEGAVMRSAIILVVDDDALIAMSTVDMVAELGHQGLEASSGKAALAILASEQPVDAMITDYTMPGMSGVELASQARMLRPDLPILVASGYAELPDGVDSDLPRLGKPYSQSELAAALSQLLGEGRR